MKVLENGSLKYIQFDNISKTGLVRHYFSTRCGGVSEDEFCSMNLSFTRGDKRENVIENFKIMEKATGIDYNNTVMSCQTHTTNVKVVTKDDVGKGVTRDNDLYDTDALVTNEKGVAITTFSADCVPLFFLDTENKVIALAHAGWRGTVNGIATETVKTMVEKFNTNPKNIVSAIGPSIGKCCFQVDMPVVSEFMKKIEDAQRFIEKDSCEGKFKIDLWGVNAFLMEKCGIPKENIEITNLCTMCNPELFYSHRVMGNKRGSMVAVMELI
ncbi:MAG: peptidoglycan editing factor PgeF [Tyzzerella sp.]|uniref:Purine nucleoside phosphorylase n=1 Tax=Candidatus Fimicola merdigallinarum TaxID=2840819 RepID=A0A9D9H3E3_9FIRM|nr:peptidoglycan editing factor PgeF [Candidatus Fimicola merdigallinarum]